MNRSDVCRFGRGSGGFSYIWLLLLLALMGAGLAAGATIHATAVQRDKEQELLAIGRQYRVAIGRYYETQGTTGKHEYPATLDDLLEDHRGPGIRRHLRKIFIDPMTREAKWGLVQINGRTQDAFMHQFKIQKAVWLAQMRGPKQPSCGL